MHNPLLHSHPACHPLTLTALSTDKPAIHAHLFEPNGAVAQALAVLAESILPHNTLSASPPSPCLAVFLILPA